MFHEYREEISKLKVEDNHFAKIFERHNELDDKINNVEQGRDHLDDVELEKLKKEKLRLKDEAHNILMTFINK
jgi:uncharacterized protein YdcH (DUF465 family)